MRLLLCVNLSTGSYRRAHFDDREISVKARCPRYSSNLIFTRFAPPRGEFYRRLRSSGSTCKKRPALFSRRLFMHTASITRFHNACTVAEEIQRICDSARFQSRAELSELRRATGFEKLRSPLVLTSQIFHFNRANTETERFTREIPVGGRGQGGY